MSSAIPPTTPDKTNFKKCLNKIIVGGAPFNAATNFIDGRWQQKFKANASAKHHYLAAVSIDMGGNDAVALGART